MNQLRTVVEAWPALLTEEMAARYLSIEPAAFRCVAAKLQVQPVEFGEHSRWPKSDLDQMIRRLAARPSLLKSAEISASPRLADVDVERIAEAVSRRLGPVGASPQRAVVSIKEACALLG